MKTGTGRHGLVITKPELSTYYYVSVGGKYILDITEESNYITGKVVSNDGTCAYFEGVGRVNMKHYRVEVGETYSIKVEVSGNGTVRAVAVAMN